MSQLRAARAQRTVVAMAFVILGSLALAICFGAGHATGDGITLAGFLTLAAALIALAFIHFAKSTSSN